MISGLRSQASGKEVHVAYDITKGSDIYRTTRKAAGVSLRNVELGSFMFQYHTKNIKYSEWKDGNRTFNFKYKKSDNNIYYPLISSTKLESPAEAQAKADALKNQLNQVQAQLTQAADQQAQAAAQNAALLASNQNLADQIQRLNEQMNALLSLVG